MNSHTVPLNMDVCNWCSPDKLSTPQLTRTYNTFRTTSLQTPLNTAKCLALLVPVGASPVVRELQLQAGMVSCLYGDDVSAEVRSQQ